MLKKINIKHWINFDHFRQFQLYNKRVEKQFADSIEIDVSIV